VNVEHYAMGEPAPGVLPDTATRDPDPLNYGWRDYGPRVGIWRMMDLLDKYRLRASMLLNADVCRLYPRIIEEGVKRDWAWLAHGKNNSMFAGADAPTLSVDEERRYLREVVTTIHDATGQAPQGWLGPLGLSETAHTLDLLADLGVRYVLDWVNDDQPYPLRVARGRMISVPYSLEVNDLPLFLKKSVSGPEFGQLLIDQFDVLYEESARIGRVMAIGLHPFVAGQPFRHKYIDWALAHITAHEDVWLTTSDEIADWYFQHYYDQATAQH